MIYHGYFPGGRKRAVTLSYDDGQIHDRRLIALLNQYGIKGTFHLNSGKLNTENYISADEVEQLYKGHEVALHTKNHMYLTQLPKPVISEEIREDKIALEKLCGYPLAGFSYPFGAYNESVVSCLKANGVLYARTINGTGKFALPDDWLMWNPTCRHCKDLELYTDIFLDETRWMDMRLFYLWGHSYEFETDRNWNLIENFCKRVSGHPDIWFATNLQIYDYMNAVKGLRISSDETRIYNPSATEVWIGTDHGPACILPGELCIL